MRGLTVFLLIFISYNFDEIAGDKSKVEKWLSMKIEDVDEQCKSAGKEKLDRKVLSKYYQGINDYGGNEKLEGSSDFDYFLNHTYDTMMVENMKDVIRSVQNCVNDENRLQPEDSIAVMKHVLQMHAKKILAIGVISEQDSKNCKSTNKLETCGKRYDKIFRNGPGTNLSLIQLLIPSYMEVSTCAEALPAERCVMKYLRDCESGIQKYFQVAFTPSENIDAICENFLHDVVSDTDDVNEDTTATGTGTLKFAVSF